MWVVDRALAAYAQEPRSAGVVEEAVRGYRLAVEWITESRE
ncbi:hypothetical protein [Kitasatospora aureofaciens]